MKYRIRVRIAELNLKYAYLIEELRKMGERVNPSDLSNYVNGRVRSAKADRILAECDMILTRIERERKEPMQ
jgi:histidinol-phosphate/aromatic aminotransferase/cobyric acid decarboxylase-like protein